MSHTVIPFKVPAVGESVSEVEVSAWFKQVGDPVRSDESVVVLETDKATVVVPAPATGQLGAIHKRPGERVRVGELLGEILVAPSSLAPAASASAAASSPPAPPSPAPAASPPSALSRVMPAAAHLMAVAGLSPDQVQPTGPGGRILKEDAQRAATAPPSPVPAAPPPMPAPSVPPPSASSPLAPPASTPIPASPPARPEKRVPMTLLRRKIAERLVQAQQAAALLTTFNEADMSVVMALRKEHQERFQARYQAKLGLMGFFVKATIAALQEVPQLNAELRGTDIVYRDYYDVGVAIGGGRGLVVPVLRDAERMSWAEIELAIADFARRVKENQIKPDELQGGTFTLTNGGLYGSLLSTPLVNPPQSGVLGLHTIQERPVAVAGQVVIRPMMYLALTYDHRLVDGREAVTFLRRVKELIETPVRLLLEV